MLRKTFSCSELCSRWDININDLTGIVREKNLRALNRKYKFVSKDEHGYFYQMLGNPAGGTLSPGPLPITDELGFYFNVADVEACEKENGITPQLPTTAARQKENQKSTLITEENAFVHQGDAWKIWFNGNELNPIKNMHGLTYIANLLSKPNKAIHVTTLCDSVNPQKKNQAMMEEDDVIDSLNRGDMNISAMRDGLSNEEKERLAKIFRELEKTMADHYLPESERLEAKQEYDAQLKTLKNQYGKGALKVKAPKKVNEAVKKDIDRVLKAINRAYERIHKQSPELCDHLRKNIKTGSQCYYGHSYTLWHISF